MTTKNPVRRTYTEAFKGEAVALITEQGYKLSEAARSVDVNANLLSKWRDRFAEESAGTRLTGDERDELKQLRKEVRLLKMEKEILKKASQYFAKEMRSTARMQEVEQRRSSCREVRVYLFERRALSREPLVSAARRKT
jgi:transposase